MELLQAVPPAVREQLGRSRLRGACGPRGGRCLGPQQVPHDPDRSPAVGHYVMKAAHERRPSAGQRAEEIDRPKCEARRDPCRSLGPFQGAKAPDEEPEQRRVRVALGRETSHALDGPCTLAQPLEMLPHAHERRDDIEVVDPDEPTKVVDYGQTGRVRLTTLTKEFFMPRFLERDECERERPCEKYHWDGVRNVRPFSRFQRTVVEGVY